jgi:hypothetical protein
MATESEQPPEIANSRLRPEDLIRIGLSAAVPAEQAD